MIAKGTSEYRAAQELANRIEMNARCPKNANTASKFEFVFEKFYGFMFKVSEVAGFAGEVAKTVFEGMHKANYQVGFCTSKQAWIVACAAIENGIEY